MSSSESTTDRARTVVTWILRIVLAAMFVFTGSLKLAGVPEMVALFDAIGIGQWFRYVTGGLEVLGAIGLLVPRLPGPAALGLSGVMVGAILTHLVVVGGSPLVPIVLLVLLAVVAWLRFADTVWLVRSVLGRAGAPAGARARTAGTDRVG